METVEGQASVIAGNEALTGDYDFSKKYVRGISLVGSDDVKNVAAQYLNKENASIVKILPEDSSSDAVKPATSARPAARTFSMQRLANNIPLIIIEDQSLPIVCLRAVYRGGLLYEAEKKGGISNLTSNILYKGTENKSEEEVVNAVENLGGNISNFSGKNSLGITINLLSKNTYEGLDLLAEIVQTPAFSDDVLRREKDLVTAEIDSQDENAIQRALLNFKKALYGDHPYSRRTLGEKATISDIERADVLEFYERCLDPEKMVVAVTGDVKKEDLICAAEDLSGKIKSGLANTSDGSTTPEFKAASVREKTKKEQSVVVIGCPGAKVDEQKKYILDVIASVLSGSDGRLYLGVRNKTGTSYTQGAFSVPGIDRGYFALYVATTKDNIPEVTDILRDELEKISKREVSDEELESAKKKLINEKRSSRQSISFLSFESALDELYGLGYENLKDYENKINAISKKDILDTASELFRKDKLVESVIEGTK
jgi:zinc protease